MVFSAYVMVSLQTSVFTNASDEVTMTRSPASRHVWWDDGPGWKRMLNNLGLLI